MTGKADVWATADEMWKAFVADAPPSRSVPARYTTFAFGADAATADSLAELVRTGAKVATSSLLWEDETAIASPGDVAIVLDGRDRPVCVIETLEVRVAPFEEVTPEMAAAEGEDDRTLDSWRAVHWEFFGQVCAEIGRMPTMTMPIVWERFKRVFPR